MTNVIVEKTHSRSAFYKYMPSSTAEIVLANNTLRWSSPLLFNDPFDVPKELAHELTPRDIQEAVIKLHIELYENIPDDVSDLNPVMQFLLKAAKKANSQDRIEEIVSDLRNSLSEDPPESANLDEFRAHWKKRIPTMRILCLCKSYDKTSMWYHYANRYAGAVIEFLCTDEVAAPWRIAEPIEYTDQNHIVSTAKGWASLMSMDQEKALQKLFDVSVYTKSKDWAYEKEWRIASYKSPHESGLYSDYHFDGRSIGNLYLGPLISEESQENLVNLAVQYPNMKIYKASIGVSRKMRFNRVSG